MNNLKKGLAAMAIVVASAALAGCPSGATVASHNLAKAAENFEIERRIVFLDSMQGNLLVIEGKCSTHADAQDSQLEVTCKTGEDEFKKHTLGLSRNVTYVVEQVESAKASPYHYRVDFRPETIIPSVNIKTSGGES